MNGNGDDNHGGKGFFVSLSFVESWARIVPCTGSFQACCWKRRAKLAIPESLNNRASSRLNMNTSTDTPEWCLPRRTHKRNLYSALADHCTS
ncbi:hypothetical protein MPTK1_7g15430 [Marchantia polymorpha subsp. ruderalis]|uniref:Uncharacterized protein n=2 Tax=Marchantia polymorpha TaxID=3197 RepID=A0AAF6BZV9_MARPO|nr:hypothetical protein MARPO_0009s0227 [Marchantia polymorpha]PTQ47150.1 hypothetical protein MARPO_0009s0227 [Marchantia polymorpha]BBN17543.1 hypothetical protein Mp_7g15430 [Marchantia polymorpha subsp. ruderalis]BBN17544.1 hypothetical protein Mp_7g15430 [Marchantia polymorpha subsp. ruderalis]|eukprot:PTQ47149.1 hypothetical protein MARPO_0009s0227 [Marchantia polymorpha]